MSLTINHNLMASNTARNLSTHYGSLGVSTRRLSSGLRIGTAADDAAGLAVRETMRADIASLGQGVRNANDAISMIQVADGALQVIDEKLIRMKELATQAATGTYTAAQRAIINDEFQAMKDEIDRIANSTEFNGIKLLSGGRRTEKIEDNTDLFMHFTFDNDFTGEFGEISNPTNSVTLTGNGPYNGGASLIGQTGDVDMPGVPPGGFIGLPQVDWANIGNNVSMSIWVNEGDIAGPSDQISYVTFNGTHVHIHRDGNFLQYKIGNNEATIPFDVTQRGDWIYHTMTLDDESFRVYQNGNLIHEETSVVPIGAPISGREDENAIGRSWWTHNGNRRSAARLTGLVDDFKIYSRTLNDEEINEYYAFSNLGPRYASSNEQGIIIHFGTGNDANEDYYSTKILKVDATGLGIDGIHITTQESAQNALTPLTEAIIYKDKVRASLGATQNRLENTITNLEIQAENLQAAESRISDADMATEMTEFVKSQILTQSATAMLAQANALPEMALQLIQG